MREELYHPMLVHFPIVLLFVAWIFKGLEVIFLNHPEKRERLNSIGRWFFFSGPAFYLLAMYLGDAALEIIKKDFPDLKAAYAHEEMAKSALILIVAALTSEAISQIPFFKKQIPKISVVLTFLLLTGSYALVLKAAHSGALLVYDEGAAVKAPTKTSP